MVFIFFQNKQKIPVLGDHIQTRVITKGKYKQNRYTLLKHPLLPAFNLNQNNPPPIMESAFIFSLKNCN